MKRRTFLAAIAGAIVAVLAPARALADKMRKKERTYTIVATIGDPANPANCYTVTIYNARLVEREASGVVERLTFANDTMRGDVFIERGALTSLLPTA